MKKYTILFLFLSMHFLAASQVVVLDENFDTDTVPLLPLNWETTSISGIGFRTENSNSSDNTGASGGNNVVIRNTDSTGTYVLTSPSFSTSGLQNIKVLFSSRVSNNFLTSGSTLPILEFSSNNGQSWEPIAYNDNAANSIWAVVNDSVPIELPVSADNNPAVRLRWSVSIINDASGSFRIDDVLVFGIESSTGVAAENGIGMEPFPNPCFGAFNFREKEVVDAIEIRDLYGKIQLRQILGAPQFTVDVTNLVPGVYFYTLFSGKRMFTQSFIMR